MKSKKLSPLAVYLVCAAAIVLLLAADQYTKSLAVQYLKDQPSIELIPGGFGAVLSGKPRYGIRTSAGSVLAVCYDDGIVSDRHGDCLLQASKDTPLFTAFAVLTVLTAGAVGNFYDRFLNHYVVDFIYVSLINFPVFNVADIYVTVSVAVFLLLYLLYYKDEDFAFLHKNAKKEESDG
ncbi:MAG: signal peptidase II [Fusicatenibacter saccharivorans]